LRLQPRTLARRAEIVRAVLRQQHADVHLVGAAFEPGEEALHAVPLALAPGAFALDHPVAFLVAELGPRHVDAHAALSREAQQIVLTLAIALALERLHRTLGEGLVRIRNREPVVDADGAAEAAAGL